MSQGRKTKESPPPSPSPPTTTATATTSSNNSVKKTDAKLPSPLRVFNASQQDQKETKKTDTDTSKR